MECTKRATKRSGKEGVLVKEIDRQPVSSKQSTVLMRESVCGYGYE